MQILVKYIDSHRFTLYSERILGKFPVRNRLELRMDFTKIAEVEIPFHKPINKLQKTPTSKYIPPFWNQARKKLHQQLCDRVFKEFGL